MRKLFVFLLCSCCATFAYGEYITTNVINGCDGTNVLRAVFAPSEYTCSSGYYLPANAIVCAICPSGYTCDGGTFTFNETVNQGREYTIPIVENVVNGCNRKLLTQQLYPKFTPNEHTCSAGYYMPANTDGCVICPANSYCSGGTYTFNETVAQGVQSCAAGLYSPTGMSSATQCGHILHIGNDIVYLHSVKKTTPSLHAKVGDTVFYGNMTTADVVMHAGSERKLKVQYNNTTYSVYDDTVQINE